MTPTMPDTKEIPVQTPAVYDRVFQLAVDALAHGVVLVDATGRIVLANRWMEHRFGFTGAELTGRPLQGLLPTFVDVPRQTAITRSGARPRHGREFTVEVSVTALSESLWLITVDQPAASRASDEDDQGDRRAVEKQIEFERVVSELSASFINLPDDQLDQAMLEGLQRFGETLDLDRCTFFRFAPEFVAVAPVGWVRPGIPAAPAPISVRERFPWVFESVSAGQVVCFSSVEEIPSAPDREGYRGFGVRSSVTVPLAVGGRVVGAVGFNVLRHEREWPADVVHRLRLFATAFGSVLARRESDEAIRRALGEVKRLRDQLQAENLYLRSEARERLGKMDIVGQSPAIRRVLEQAAQVAATGSTVLLRGETGTGKELLAARIHALSGRRHRRMVRVNCAAIPSTLLESELFGREKGAFTGALSQQIGRFELANDSTIFLDEIGDLPVEVQVKLLRVLEERQIERLGSPQAIRVDIRVIAATHRNLEQRISDGAFREDLFYRLNVFPIEVPPLRERVEDIPLLAWRFVEEFARTLGKPIDSISRPNMEELQRYRWPGNIRELRNVVERAMILATGRRLTITMPTVAAPRSRTERLEQVEKEHIRGILESTGWRIRGIGGAAERLGLRPTTLETRIAKLGLQRPKKT